MRYICTGADQNYSRYAYCRSKGENLLSNISRFLAATFILTAVYIPVGEPSFAAMLDFVEETRAGLGALESDNLVEAEKHLKAAMETAKISKAPKYGEYTKSLLNLGLLYEKKKESSQAEIFYREALKNYVDAFGEKSLESSIANQYLGDLYRKTGKYDSAIKCYEKAKDVRELAAPNHPDLADTLAGLAQCKAKTASKDQAIPLMQKVISIRETAFGKTSGKVVRSRMTLASLYNEIGKPKLAIPAYETVIEIVGPTEIRSALAYEGLASCYEKIGKPAKVDECYKQALKTRESHPGKEIPALNNCVKEYSSYLRSISKVEEAKQLEARFAKKPK